MSRNLVGRTWLWLDGNGRRSRCPQGNARNGFTPKSLLTESGVIALNIPRDRDGSFTPQFVPRGTRRLPGFDETVIMQYAGGLSTREL